MLKTKIEFVIILEIFLIHVAILFKEKKACIFSFFNLGNKNIELLIYFYY